MDGTRVFLAELVREPKFEIIIYCNKKAPVCLFSLAWEKTAGAFEYVVGEIREATAAPLTPADGVLYSRPRIILLLLNSSQLSSQNKP